RAYWHERGADVKVRNLLEWTGTLRAGAGSRNSAFRIACPWGNNTMAIHQNGDVVACAVDYGGGFVVGNVREHSVKELWSALGVRLRRPHREHRWDELPALCRGCTDWQVVGAELHEAASFSSA
ncbi:MAG: SPASM domain-containing protein, partial [Acidobacteria bacterium]|nr:SPASM domain-containing protein [Acidobacteriota bacterium]